MMFNNISKLAIRTSQISSKSLSLILLQITFQDELSKLPGILFHTLSNLLKIVKFETVILKVMGRKEFGF